MSEPWLSIDYSLWLNSRCSFQSLIVFVPRGDTAVMVSSFDIAFPEVVWIEWTELICNSRVDRVFSTSWQSCKKLNPFWNHLLLPPISYLDAGSDFCPREVQLKCLYWLLFFAGNVIYWLQQISSLIPYNCWRHVFQWYVVSSSRVLLNRMSIIKKDKFTYMEKRRGIYALALQGVNIH